METYKFWSVNIPSSKPYTSSKNEYPRDWRWLCIPPDEKYLPKAGQWGMRDTYPIAAVRKHEEELLPPPSYWLKPEYESIVYQGR